MCFRSFSTFGVDLAQAQKSRPRVWVLYDPDRRTLKKDTMTLRPPETDFRRDSATNFPHDVAAACSIHARARRRTRECSFDWVPSVV